MHKRTKSLITTGALVALISGAGLVYADRGGSGHHFSGKHGCGHGSHQRGGKRWFGSTKHMEGKLAFMRTELKITPEQEPVWEQFAGSLRDLAANRSRARGEFKHNRSTDQADVIERMDRRLAMMESGMEHLRTVSTAFKELYSKFDSEQREVVNSLRPIRHL